MLGPSFLFSLMRVFCVDLCSGVVGFLVYVGVCVPPFYTKRKQSDQT